MQIQESINLLGLKVEDKITGFKGVVVTIGFDLFGCVQAIVRPSTNKDNKMLESEWFDVDRLKVTSTKPVMNVPSFVNTKGPEIKSTNHY